jgi:hypothetical protein
MKKIIVKKNKTHARMLTEQIEENLFDNEKTELQEKEIMTRELKAWRKAVSKYKFERLSCGLQVHVEQ